MFPRTTSERQYTYDHEKYNDNKVNNSAYGVFDSAATAFDSVAASNVAKNIMEQGGSVVDAAIAGMLCNGICNAHSMGIGGGFFMLYYNRKEEKVTVLDARETAPAASTSEMFSHHSKTKGGLSIAVPGEIKGYWQAHKMFGQMKWSKLFQPTIEMCNNGFALPASQAKFLKYCESKILDSKPLRETYVNRLNNQVYKENSMIKRPKLAKTLEVIAKEGESAFYNGSLTDSIIDEITSSGGIITKADLMNYECLIKQPVTYKMRNAGVVLNSAPAPSCGVLLNFILAIMDGYEHEEFTLECEDTNALFTHRFLEACKFAFGLRCLVGDENLTNSHLNRVLSDDNVVEEYRQLIDDNSVHPINFYGSRNFLNDHGTSHASLIGPNGDAVAITSSINLVFGSKVMGEKTNILYNNQMDDFSAPNCECNSFSLPNYKINFIEPGKRPVSSMTPLIAINSEDKSARLVCGSSGGTRIITSTAMTAAKNLLLKENIVDAVDDYRVHHQLFPDEALYENGFDPNTVDILSNKGHRMINFGNGGSVVQAIERLGDGRLQAVCDSRKGGEPFGF